MSKCNVGDKFVIEIDRIYEDSSGNLLYGVRGFNSLVFDDNGIEKLTKLANGITESDLRKAHAQGFNEGSSKALEILGKQIAQLSQITSNTDKFS